MALRTAEQYIESLRDGRTVYFRGQRVADVTTHPVISVAVNHAAIDYRLAEEPSHRSLCVVNDGDGDYGEDQRGAVGDCPIGRFFGGVESYTAEGILFQLMAGFCAHGLPFWL